MKEIKFRCWWDNKMHKVSGFDNVFGTQYIDLYAADTIKAKEGILMQYIGLKDINGKEIYEGDIVELIYEEDNETITGRGIVKYIEDMTGFFCVSFDGNCTSSILNPRVIGNIYENKELLEVK